MLNHNQIREIETGLTITANDEANAKVEDIMTHVRGLMEILNYGEMQLQKAVAILEQRKAFLDGVIDYAKERLDS